jgi:cell division protein ZapE
MQLIDYYQQQCQNGIIKPDPEQLAALDVFQAVSDNLQRNRKSSGLLRLRKPKHVKGLYVWGGVGIGKTLLMDCFFHCLPFQEKLRLHFHAFMQLVHHELKKHEGHADPLHIIAKEFSRKYKVICFDEFIVTDIVDAMLLGRLLKTMIDSGVCFVTTSNTEPDNLYKNGLQRTSFLPAIELINNAMHIIHLNSQIDYRLLQIQKSGVFFTPDDAHADESMKALFHSLTRGHDVIKEPLVINDRDINFSVRTEEVVWFGFKDICHVPRSQKDYLELAMMYKIIFISHVPVLATSTKDSVLLFIRLIDVLYDARIRIILSATHASGALFAGLENMPESARTQSRLIEMQSERYLAA